MLEFVASFAFLVCITISQDIPPYTTEWFTQDLNHFNPQDTRTFQERYLIWDDVWDKSNNAPIFFYAGNEGDVGDFWNNTGLMFDLAPHYKALVLFAEHR